MVGTGLEEAPRVLTIDRRERPAERLLVGARGSGFQPGVKAGAEQVLDVYCQVLRPTTP